MSKDAKIKLVKYGKSRREGYRRNPVRDLASTLAQATINITTRSKEKDRVVHLARRLVCLAAPAFTTETWRYKGTKTGRIAWRHLISRTMQIHVSKYKRFITH